MLSDRNPDFPHPVQSDEFLPPISLLTTLAGLFSIASVGAAFTLAAFLKYNVTVKAPATVRPVGELRIVQAAMEGTVTSILVKENQEVKQGGMIARLDNSRLQTQKSQLQENIQQNHRQLKQMAAQISALNAQQLAESSLMNRTIASAQAGLSLNQREYKDKQITTQTEVQAVEAAVELAREEMKRYQQLASTGVIAQLQVKEKEQAFKSAQARLAGAKAALNPSAAPVTMANERIAQERARSEATLAALNKERENLLQRQIEIQNQISRDARELQQISVELTKTFILAPVSGTILKLDLRNPGQVVSPGTSIAQIAPSHASLEVKARVAAQDIGKVRLCKEEKVSDCFEGKVQLRISAYPYPDYGTLKGAVRAIAPDAITPSSSQVAIAAPYYEVTIQPEKTYLVKSDSPTLPGTETLPFGKSFAPHQRQYPIQPGMDVTADIISREETVLTFILRKARLLTDL